MNAAAPMVFLLDVDDTLLDNDQVQNDLDAHIAKLFGADAAKTYWTLYETLRDKLGYADYLGAIQQFRLDCEDEVRAQDLAAYLLNYPFAERLYPGALDAIAHLSQFGECVVLSDGDVVLQPRKIEASGIARAVQDRVLIYVHKERMLDDVARRFPAQHYVMVEDKLRVLDGMQRRWRERLTTVFVRQGHYANDPAARKEYPPAQIELSGIGELCKLDADAFLFPSGQDSSKPATATEQP
ncbi:MAG TPA: HAD family hydrolase [Rhodanobacteraceae bacterium]|nr:HAD family hydrolase [Rhodanobacteraceae bacterium]